MSHGLRVLLRAGDPVRRQGLAAMLEAAGHTLGVARRPTSCCATWRGTPYRRARRRRR